jgi:hypothetical protein
MDVVTQPSAGAAAQATRSKIDRLEAEMLQLPQVAIPTAHSFGPGFYARTILVPEGAALTGKVHATEHIFMLTHGEMSVLTEDGMKRVKAPFQQVCRPGLKRVGLAHTDCLCTNIHITDETDLDKLEAELIIAPALPAPAAKEELPCHG